MGDASDNIPGVAGIGEKTALALIAEVRQLARASTTTSGRPGRQAGGAGQADRQPRQGRPVLYAGHDPQGRAHRDRPCRLPAPAPVTPLPPRSCWPRWKCTSWWTAGACTRRHRARPIRECRTARDRVEPSALPAAAGGPLRTPRRNADGDWYLVQGQDVYLPDIGPARAADYGQTAPSFGRSTQSRSTAWRWSTAASAVRCALTASWPRICSNPSASGYEVHSLAAEYGVRAGLCL